MLSAKLLQLMEHFDATLIREIPRLHSHAVEREANEAKQQPPPLRRRRGEYRRGGGAEKNPIPLPPPVGTSGLLERSAHDLLSWK